MKKIWAFVCILTILFILTACGGQTDPNQNGVPNSGSRPILSGVVSGDAVSKVPTTKAVSKKSVGEYEIKTLVYSYEKDNMVYTASFPEFSGNLANLDKMNESMKNCALKTINSLGTGKKKGKTTVKVNCDITFQNKNFISVGFNERTKLSAEAEANHELRTVNINLKTGEPVGVADMIVKSDALYMALGEAAKEQLSAELAPAVTANVIKEGMEPNTIYFTGHGVGFSVQISKPNKRHVTLTLTFEQAKPYMTQNEVWKNFM